VRSANPDETIVNVVMPQRERAATLVNEVRARVWYLASGNQRRFEWRNVKHPQFYRRCVLSTSASQDT
jgi:hypothetical protein